jgi:hypothetical protein
MYLRSTPRVKDGKTHRYFSIVESRRLRSGKVAQRQVLYLGEINDSQQAAWRKRACGGSRIFPGLASRVSRCGAERSGSGCR